MPVTNIRINCICPGTIDTPLLHSSSCPFFRNRSTKKKQLVEGLKQFSRWAASVSLLKSRQAVAFLLADESLLLLALLSADGGQSASNIQFQNKLPECCYVETYPWILWSAKAETDVPYLTLLSNQLGYPVDESNTWKTFDCSSRMEPFMQPQKIAKPVAWCTCKMNDVYRAACSKYSGLVVDEAAWWGKGIGSILLRR